MTNKKRTAVVLLVLLLCISIIGCSKGDTKTVPETTTSITNSISNKKTTTTSNSVITTDTTKAKSADKNKSTAITTAKKKQNDTAANSKSDSKDKTNKKSSSTQKSPNPAPKQTTKKAEATSHNTTNRQLTTQTNTKQKDVCYITIECKDILSHFDDLKAGHSQYVPANGYIAKNYSYTISNNDTVYDVLKKCCDDNNVALTERNSQYGKYIVGINQLDEKDCGRYSGWLYYVNDKSPAFACNKYNVSANDEIVFHYTCEY